MAGIWIYSEDIVVAWQLLTLGREAAYRTGQPLAAVALRSEEAPALIARGADTVFVLSGENPRPESYARPLAELAAREQPYALFIGATARGKDVAARVATALGAGLVSEAIAVRVTEGAVETDRMMYGGLAVCTETLSAPALVTVPPRTFEPAPADASRQGAIVTVAAVCDDRVDVREVCPVVRQGADIGAADKLVCVGRGLEKREDLALAEDLAAALGAEIGCTRGIAEDYHWLPTDRYIGLSGLKVKPGLYIAVGVSGQVQHVAGIRDAKVIVAIDRNESAPIFEAADYGIVGDLYEVVPALVAALRKAGG